jgi:hypothetical protein
LDQTASTESYATVWTRSLPDALPI